MFNFDCIYNSDECYLNFKKVFNFLLFFVKIILFYGWVYDGGN